jgi:hypothetical protein
MNRAAIDAERPRDSSPDHTSLSSEQHTEASAVVATNNTVSNGRLFHVRGLDRVTVLLIPLSDVLHTEPVTRSRDGPAGGAAHSAAARRIKNPALCPDHHLAPDSIKQCPRGNACPFVHADLTNARVAHPHEHRPWSQISDVPYSLAVPLNDRTGSTADAESVPVLRANCAKRSSLVRRDRILLTRALQLAPEQPLRHCAHFVNKNRCDFGSECAFVHAIVLEGDHGGSSIHPRRPRSPSLETARDFVPRDTQALTTQHTDSTHHNPASVPTGTRTALPVSNIHVPFVAPPPPPQSQLSMCAHPFSSPPLHPPVLGPYPSQQTAPPPFRTPLHLAAMASQGIAPAPQYGLPLPASIHWYPIMANPTTAAPPVIPSPIIAPQPPLPTLALPALPMSHPPPTPLCALPAGASAPVPYAAYGQDAFGNWVIFSAHNHAAAAPGSNSAPPAGAAGQHFAPQYVMWPIRPQAAPPSDGGHRR